MCTEVKIIVEGHWSDSLSRPEDLLLAEESSQQFGSDKEKTHVKANLFLNKLNHISDQKISRSDFCLCEAVQRN